MVYFWVLILALNLHQPVEVGRHPTFHSCAVAGQRMSNLVEITGFRCVKVVVKP